jgi:hypothetical protein
MRKKFVFYQNIILFFRFDSNKIEIMAYVKVMCALIVLLFTECNDRNQVLKQ